MVRDTGQAIEAEAAQAAVAGEGQHAVTVTESLSGRRARTLKDSDSFAVLDHSGDLRAGSVDGLYHNDTRHLSVLELSLAGARPILLSSTLRDDNVAMICDLTNSDLSGREGGAVRGDTLHVRRVQFLWDGALYERIRVRNFGDAPARLRLGLSFGADFADIFEVRGDSRARRGAFAPTSVDTRSVTCRYTGLDGQERRTVLRFDPAPDQLGEREAAYELNLPPGGDRYIFLTVSTGPGGGAGPSHFRTALRAKRRALRLAMTQAAAIETTNDVFNEAIRRSIADLYMLATDTGYGPYPYAGIPWFSTPFGRDALITAFETLWFDAAFARGVLRYLAANQATGFDAASDAEPGKILHEVRRGEMAETGEVPFRRYYGSVDSTPLFIMLAAAYLRRTGDVATLRDLWPALSAALGWIEAHGDRDGDGFLEYGRMSDTGLVNQGWKDSHDSIFHADGSMARGPIALCEVQGYAYAAWEGAAAIAEALGNAVEAARLRLRAAAMRERFDEVFWSEDLGTYALALDGEKKPCRVRSSNAGHALWTGIALPERAASVARVLMAPASFSGWGVRTIAEGEARYNPMSYHNGSVWPHDNALIAAGLARYGFKDAAARIFEALFDASVHMDLRRLPELFCGFGRTKGQGPTAYPVACIPQAWAAAAPIGLLAACLGLGFDPARGRAEIADPVLPGFLDGVILRNLRVGDGSLDIEISRAAEDIAAAVLRRSGGTKLLVTH